MEIIKAPKDYSDKPHPWIFLAGSIESDTAERWQDDVEDKLSELKGTILNPRRDDWDKTWKQTIEDPRFKEQVEWELKGQDDTDIIAMYFDPQTKAPITLLELGINAVGRKPLFVCCPDGYWRKGNVEIVMHKYGHADQLYNDREKWLKDVASAIANYKK